MFLKDFKVITKQLHIEKRLQIARDCKFGVMDCFKSCFLKKIKNKSAISQNFLWLQQASAEILTQRDQFRLCAIGL